MAQKSKKRSRPTLPVLPSLLLPESPPSVQIHNQRVMRAEWIDPGDDNPNRRTARMVTGFRARCPLRRCIARFGARGLYARNARGGRSIALGVRWCAAGLLRNVAGWKAGERS